MEGNFRIVQESDNRFVIEKEVDSYEYKPVCFIGLNLWQKKTPIKKWRKVDAMGKFPYSHPLIDIRTKDIWYLTYEEAKKAYGDIKKYPKVVYGKITLSDLNNLLK